MDRRKESGPLSSFSAGFFLPSFPPSFRIEGAIPLVSFDTWEALVLVVERGAFLSVHSFPSQRANGRDREEGNKGPFMATV